MLRAVRTTLVLVAIFWTHALVACSQPALRADADSRLPSERALAAAMARSDERVTDAKLVDLLDSQDPAVRLLAIDALERRTGETLGYHFADPPTERALAVERWASRVRSQSGGSAAR